MMKLIEELKALLCKADLRRLLGHSMPLCVSMNWTGYRIYNFLYETVVPTVYRFHLSCSLWSNMWNMERLSFRHVQCMVGITVRRAVGAVVLRIWKKQMPFCNEMDRACNMAQLEIRILRILRSRCPLPIGVQLRENLGNL